MRYEHDVIAIASPSSIPPPPPARSAAPRAAETWSESWSSTISPSTIRSCGVNAAAAAADASTSAASDGTGDGDGAHDVVARRARRLRHALVVAAVGRNSTGRPEATEAASSARKAPPAIEWVSEASSAAAPISIGSPCAAVYSSSSAWRSEWFIPGRKAGIGGGPPAAAGYRRRCVRSAAAFIGTPTERSITISRTVMSSIATRRCSRPRHRRERRLPRRRARAVRPVPHRVRAALGGRPPLDAPPRQFGPRVLVGHGVSHRLHGRAAAAAGAPRRTPPPALRPRAHANAAPARRPPPAPPPGACGSTYLRGCRGVHASVVSCVRRVARSQARASWPLAAPVVVDVRAPARPALTHDFLKT